MKSLPRKKSVFCKKLRKVLVQIFFILREPLKEKKANCITLSFLCLQKNSDVLISNHGAAVAQQQSTWLETESSWVGIPPGTGLIFSSLSSQQCILHSGPSKRCNATDFPTKNMLSRAACGKASVISMDCAKNPTIQTLQSETLRYFEYWMLELKNEFTLIQNILPQTVSNFDS